MAVPVHDLRRAAAAIASTLVAAPAWASDPKGLLGALLHLPVFVWAGINLLACLVLALFGAYRSHRVATVHAWIAAAGPVFGLLALLMHAGGQDIGTLLFGVDAALLALACLPLWLHSKQRPGSGQRKARMARP